MGPNQCHDAMNTSEQSIDLRAAIHSHAASRVASRLNNRDEEVTVDLPPLHEITHARSPAPNSRPVQARPPSTTSQVPSNTSLGPTHDEEAENSNNGRIVSQFILGSSAMAMGALVQVFKGRGGKATLAAWSKVSVHKNF